MRALLVVSLLGAMAGPSAAASVTVFLDKAGMTVDRDDADEAQVQIPPFGGTTPVWDGVVGCVSEKFAPFAVDIVDTRPERGTYITALIGGRAEQLGYDGEHVAGVGVTGLDVIGDAVVHVFSRSIGETDTTQLCEVAAHEIGHAMGLDHSLQCGDLMSYPRPECGMRPTLTFLDREAACGEYESRACVDGEATQSSFGRLASLVGLREPAPDAPPASTDSSQPSGLDEWMTEAEPEPQAEPEPVAEPEPSVPAQISACGGEHARARPHQRRHRSSWRRGVRTR